LGGFFGQIKKVDANQLPERLIFSFSDRKLNKLIKNIPMIKNALPLAILLFFPFFFSCDKVDELTTWNLDAEAGIDFDVDITENDPTAISTSFTISLADNPDIADYINKIKEYKVNKVTYQIWSYSSSVANDVLLTGTLKLGAINIFLDKVNLQEMYMMGTTVTLDLTDQELAELGKTLGSNKSVSGSLAGEVTDKPVYFLIYVEFDLTLRVEG
jgi:hypothetical protein